MTEDWRRDEPEVGMVAHVLYYSKIYLYECKKHESGEFKIWWNGDDWIRVDEEGLCHIWRPVMTFAERKLKIEVERLRKFRQKIEEAFNSEDSAYDYSWKVTDAIIELREEEYEGGWDGTEKE